MTTKINNATAVDTCTKRINGIKKYVTSTKTSILIAGTPYKPAELIAVYQKALDARASTLAARVGYKAALAGRASAESTRRAVDKGLKTWVHTQFGPESTQAQELGLAPKPPAAPTVATKANALAQAKATRDARGTKGPKQKAKIKGAPPAPPGSNADASPPEVAPPATPANGGATPGAGSPPTNGAAHG